MKGEIALDYFAAGVLAARRDCAISSFRSIFTNLHSRLARLIGSGLGGEVGNVKVRSLDLRHCAAYSDSQATEVAKLAIIEVLT